MGARILDGKALAAAVRQDVARRVAVLRERGVTPGLAVLQVGDDAASQIYVRSKTRAAGEMGVQARDYSLPASTTETELLELIKRLNNDPAVNGILLQLPLPVHLAAGRVIGMLDPRKDVDGLHPENVGLLWSGRPRFVPCTPAGVMRLLGLAGTDLRGAEAVVVGRSQLVGRPLAALLMHQDATVTICHSKTRDLAAQVARADVLIAALGQPEAIRGAWVKPGAVVIDVGINRGGDKLVGDVEFAAAVERAAAITPVPGGVGPMTIAMLLENTVSAAEQAVALP